MASDRPRTSSGSWSRAADPSARRRRGPAPGWRAESRARGRPRVVRLVLTAGAYFAACGLFLWVALWLWPPRPACLVLVGAGYGTNLAIPHNVYGRNGPRG